MALKTVKENLKDRMPMIYADLILKGEKTIEDVPEDLRAAVELILHPVTVE